MYHVHRFMMYARPVFWGKRWWDARDAEGELIMSLELHLEHASICTTLLTTWAIWLYMVLSSWPSGLRRDALILPDHGAWVRLLGKSHEMLCLHIRVAQLLPAHFVNLPDSDSFESNRATVWRLAATQSDGICHSCSWVNHMRLHPLYCVFKAKLMNSVLVGWLVGLLLQIINKTGSASWQ